MTERKNIVYRARLAEQAGRYSEMMASMKEVASSDVALTVEEQNMFSLAYRNVTSTRRASWRIISSIEQQKEGRDNGDELKVTKTCRVQVEKELKDICSDILSVLDKHLIPCSDTGESKVFYYKLKGDYHRYIAEFATGNERKGAADYSFVAYTNASDIAMAELPTTHPNRLGLALNFAVLYYDILNSPVRAFRLAKAAVDNAISELDVLSEESYKDSTLILQLLSDNLTIWKSYVQAEDEGRDGASADAVAECANRETYGKRENIVNTASEEP